MRVADLGKQCTGPNHYIMIIISFLFLLVQDFNHSKILHEHRSSYIIYPFIFLVEWFFLTGALNAREHRIYIPSFLTCPLNYSLRVQNPPRGLLVLNMTRLLYCASRAPLSRRKLEAPLSRTNQGHCL